MGGKRKNDTHRASEEVQTWTTIGWVYARLYDHTVSICEGLGESIGIPGPEVAERLGELLRGKKIWQVVGQSDSLLVRGKASPAPVKRRKVEVDVRTQKQTPGKVKRGRPPKEAAPTEEAKKVGHKLGYWDTLTPQQRHDEMVHRQAVARKNRGEGQPPTGFTKGKTGWEKFKTKEERRVELARRKDVSKKKKQETAEHLATGAVISSMPQRITVPMFDLVSQPLER